VKGEALKLFCFLISHFAFDFICMSVISARTCQDKAETLNLKQKEKETEGE